MKLKKIPMRMCVGCKELKPKKELLRIVALPTGIIELDRTGKNQVVGYISVTAVNVFRKPSILMDWNVPERPVSRDVYDAIKEK